MTASPDASQNRQRAGRGFTENEWLRYVGPNLAYRQTCP
ncbi:hypothetical protein JOF56_008397 [Kibdelosporangium banguiense]|uniref:Uncharacterized protein n=1 Tax=Kibdelosporangium banguiense TaxID=1365924 RepID=A0ABS4TUC4_9PSEU|nr:hypothetical protein [Kibdelosporangium banguiense]